MLLIVSLIKVGVISILYTPLTNTAASSHSGQVQKTEGTAYRTMNPIQYIYPYRKKCFDTIQIKLATDTGVVVPFSPRKMCGGARISQSHAQLLSDIKATSVEGYIILHSYDEAKGVLLRRHSRSVRRVLSETEWGRDTRICGT